MTERELQIIEILRSEVKPALGCTEPIAVALAAAAAGEVLDMKLNKEWRDDFSITVSVSGNILKNGMGVGIPGTGMVGLHIAAALGLLSGESRFGLEVLKNINSDSIEKAKEAVNSKKVCVKKANTEEKLYVNVEVSHADVFSSATICKNHDNIVETRYNGEVLCSCKHDSESTDSTSLDISEYKLSIREIYDFIQNIDPKEIDFILESRNLNLALAQDGLNNNYGLMVGKTILSEKYSAVFGDDFLSFCMGMTAAAADARMAGSILPAMSNSGSGNQGITVTMPVIAYSMKYPVEQAVLAKALALSHLVAIHIKSYLGKLSALCGCVIASTGSSCGIIYLRGGNYESLCSAIKNMIGNITGMVCDGAKAGCAMKVASGVSCAIQSAVLSLSGICISDNEGIIEEDIEKTIQNLGKLGSKGMQNTDDMILDIMVCK